MKEKMNTKEDYDGNLLEFMSLFEDENDKIQKLLNSFLQSLFKDLRRSHSPLFLDNIFYKETDSEFVFTYTKKDLKHK